MTKKHIYDIVGIGNAMVDVIGKVSDRFLEDRNLQKGTMILTDAKTAGAIYQDIIPEREVSGGSVANTVAAMASLGCDCAFIGKVYDDEFGQIFKSDIGAAGVDFDTPPLLQGPSTARCIILVTPDAERSMFTYLGAAQNLSVDDIDENVISSSKYLFLEGYLFDRENAKQAILKAANIARQHKCQIVLTLSDHQLVDALRNDFLDFIENYTDILFANDKEIKELFQTDDLDTAVLQLKSKINIAAITCHDQGSVVIDHNAHTLIEAEKVEDVVDSSGAGDSFAAGFMYGLINNKNLKTCAKIGNIVAAEIITHYGARPKTSLRGLIRKKLPED